MNKTNNNPKYNWLAGSIRQLEDHLGTALAVPLMKQGLNKAGNLAPKDYMRPLSITLTTDVKLCVF